MISFIEFFKQIDYKIECLEFIIKIMQYNKIIHNEKQLMFNLITSLFEIPFSRPFASFSAFNLINLYLETVKNDILDGNQMIGNGFQFLQNVKSFINSRQVFRRKYQGAV